MSNSGNDPKYQISAVASILDVHQQTLRTYERLGLIEPFRSQGNTRLYSENDLKTLKKILTLTRDMGVNLAGVEVILRLTRDMEILQNEVQELIEYLRKEFRRGDGSLSSQFEQILVRSPQHSMVQLTRLDLKDVSAEN